jgi:hypothetical protein
VTTASLKGCWCYQCRPRHSTRSFCAQPGSFGCPHLGLSNDVRHVPGRAFSGAEPAERARRPTPPPPPFPPIVLRAAGCAEKRSPAPSGRYPPHAQPGIFGCRPGRARAARSRRRRRPRRRFRTRLGALGSPLPGLSSGARRTPARAFLGAGPVERAPPDPAVTAAPATRSARH